MKNKLLVTIWFFCISILFVEIGNTGLANGYELSLYSAYSLWFWLILFSAQILPFYLIYSYLFSDIKWGGPIGGGMIIMSSIIVILLPAIRGYFFYGAGDIITHLGTVQELVSTGYVSDGNFYPFLHILGAISKIVLELPIHNMGYLLSSVFLLVYVASPLLYAHIIGGEKASYISLVLFSPMIYSFFHLSNHPAFISLFLFPILLYAIEKNRTSYNIRYLVVAIPLGYAIIIGHPITAILGLVITLLPILVSQLRLKSLTIIGAERFKSRIYFGTIMIVGMVIWYIEWGFFGVIARSIFGRDLGGSPVQGTVSMLSGINLEATYLLQLFFFRYGHLFAYYLLLIFSIFLILFGKIRRDDIMFDLLAQLLFGVVVGLVFLLNPLVIGTIQRNIRWSTLFMVFFILFSIYSVFMNINRSLSEYMNEEKILAIFLIAVIILVSLSTLISICNIYQSPNIGKPNPQITEQRITGSEWLFSHLQDEDEAMYSHANLKRISTYPGTSRINPDKYTKPIPDHFGYNNKNISLPFNKSNSYMVVTRLDRVFPEVFPRSIRARTNQYTIEDISRLNKDNRVIKTYSNGEYCVFKY